MRPVGPAGLSAVLRSFPRKLPKRRNYKVQWSPLRCQGKPVRRDGAEPGHAGRFVRLKGRTFRPFRFFSSPDIPSVRTGVYISMPGAALLNTLNNAAPGKNILYLQTVLPAGQARRTGRGPTAYFSVTRNTLSVAAWSPGHGASISGIMRMILDCTGRRAPLLCTKSMRP